MSAYLDGRNILKASCIGALIGFGIYAVCCIMNKRAQETIEGRQSILLLVRRIDLSIYSERGA